MHAATLELMRDQVHAIYRAVTGADLLDDAPEPREANVELDELERRFADLEAIARHVPAVVRRVPPFSFAPPVDVLDAGSEFLIEAAAPGVDREDVRVEVEGTTLTIMGVRLGERATNGRAFLQAEIPRGPFQRSVQLPIPVLGAPSFEVEHGMIVIHVPKSAS